MKRLDGLDDGGREGSNPRRRSKPLRAVFDRAIETVFSSEISRRQWIVAPIIAITRREPVRRCHRAGAEPWQPVGDPIGRVAEIEVDEPPLHLPVSAYPTRFAGPPSSPDATTVR